MIDVIENPSKKEDQAVQVTYFTVEGVLTIVQ